MRASYIRRQKSLPAQPRLNKDRRIGPYDTESLRATNLWLNFLQINCFAHHCLSGVRAADDGVDDVDDVTTTRGWLWLEMHISYNVSLPLHT